MLEFFHGWRRRLGCITLLMALVLTGMWVRSFLGRDCMLASVWDSHFQMESFGGVILVERTTPDPILPNWHWSPSDGDVEWYLDEFLQSVAMDWQWREFRFRSGIVRLQGAPNDFWFLIVPYWSIIFPLTLLSACLILFNPHRRLQSAPDPDHA